MKLTSVEKEALFGLYKPSSLIATIEKIEWDLVRQCEKDAEGDGSGEFSREAQEQRLLRRDQYRADLLTIELLAFHKGVEAAVRWVEEFK